MSNFVFKDLFNFCSFSIFHFVQYHQPHKAGLVCLSSVVLHKKYYSHTKIHTQAFGNKRRAFARPTPSKWRSENCFVITGKHGGGAVLMVWGCFGGESAGDFVQIKGIMWKEKYPLIL